MDVHLSPVVLPGPAALWKHVPESEVWLHFPPLDPKDGTLDSINLLVEEGWQRVDRESTQTLTLPGQLLKVIYLRMPGQEFLEPWARSLDIARVQATPVALAFSLPDSIMNQVGGDEIQELPIATLLPPPAFGQAALVDDGERWHMYTIEALEERDRDRQHELGARLRAAAAPAEWWLYTDLMQACLEPNGYQQRHIALTSALLGARGAKREQLRAQLHLLDNARDQTRTMDAVHLRIRQNPDAWRTEQEEIQQMVQDLAAAYWATHEAAQRKRSRGVALPPLTSAHRVLMPSHNAARGLMQTFGPGVLPSLWSLDPGSKIIELRTPNRSLVRVTPQEESELGELHSYVREGLTPEGIKHVIGVLSAYADQTGGEGQKVDARVSLRQLLLHMGKPESHVDNPDEQRRVYQTILYLARCLVHASDRPEEPRLPGSGRRRKGREYREYSPMLVIERVQFEQDGSLRIPREVTFHLGADYYHLLFGRGRSFFAMPTALVLSYHSAKEQQELLLAMYLSDMLAWNHRQPWRVTFPVLMLQSALRSEDEMAHGHDRLRDAMRVLLALERLERDGLLLRAGHWDVDTALACELELGTIAPDVLAEATRKRLTEPPYRTLTANAEPALVRERRRRSLQHLLSTADSLALSAGPLLREQVERREAKRKEAAERNERTLAARVAKNATQIIVDAAQSTDRAEGAKPGAKRRGRPRKYP